MKRPIQIVVADDHPVFIDGIKALLKEEKSVEIVGHAPNGEILFERVKALRPQLVLTDIQMPVKDGIEATRDILRVFPDTKIIAITMLNESVSIRKMVEAGVSGYVLKTADKKELLEAITKVAEGGKHFSSEVAAQLISHYTEQNPNAGSPADILTKREKEILSLISQGLTDKEIAEKVFLSPLTIITHRKNLLSKLGLKNKVELARFALENKLG
jgi:two-component system response regulator NreC